MTSYCPWCKTPAEYPRDTTVLCCIAAEYFTNVVVPRSARRILDEMEGES